MTLLQVSHLTTYNKQSVVLNDIDFTFTSFRRLAIAGETGSGKTTLLKAIAGLVQPDKGEVRFNGERVLGPNEKLLPGHPQIAYLSQHFELRNNYKVNDFLEMASKVGEAEALRIYQLCQIDHLLTRKTDQLSGGERQRTALARLLTTSPRLLLLDEPYSNLDGIHKQVLKDVISRIVEDGTSCIMVSHDPNDVLPWAEEIMVLKEGKVIQKDSPAQVYRRPVNAYVAGLFGDYNLLSASQARSIAGIDTKPGAESFFVRPEKVGLQPASDGAETGTVAAVLFFGGYYELEVDVAGTTLLVKTTHEGYQKGDVVSLEIRPNDLWAF